MSYRLDDSLQTKIYNVKYSRRRQWLGHSPGECLGLKARCSIAVGVSLKTEAKFIVNIWQEYVQDQ